MTFFCALLSIFFVTFASAAITSFPTSFIGTGDGSYPLTFTTTGSWNAAPYSVNVLYNEEGGPQNHVCNVNATNPQQLLCNLNQDSIPPVDNVVVTVLDSSSNAVFSSNYTQGKTIATVNFQFWPVAAPVNVPTLITVNMTSDSSTNYKFDTSGKTSYACVWVFSTGSSAPFSITNLGGLFSVFSPQSNNIGTCWTPNLGNVTSQGSQTAVGPIQAELYVIGTDGYSSSVCQITGNPILCGTGFDEFEFTPEIVKSVSPNVVAWSNTAPITISGSGFRDSTFGSYIVEYFDYASSLNDNIGSTSYDCKFVSTSSLTCDTPQLDDSEPESEAAQVVLSMQRKDFSFGYSRIALANLTFGKAPSTSPASLLFPTSFCFLAFLICFFL